MPPNLANSRARRVTFLRKRRDGWSLSSKGVQHAGDEHRASRRGRLGSVAIRRRSSGSGPPTLWAIGRRLRPHGRGRMRRAKSPTYGEKPATVGRPGKRWFETHTKRTRFTGASVVNISAMSPIDRACVARPRSQPRRWPALPPSQRRPWTNGPPAEDPRGGGSRSKAVYSTAVKRAQSR